MQAFMDAIADAFGSYDDRDDDTAPGLNAVAAEFGITSLKARKLLITAGVYSTALSLSLLKEEPETKGESYAFTRGAAYYGGGEGKC